ARPSCRTQLAQDGSDVPFDLPPGSRHDTHGGGSRPPRTTHVPVDAEGRRMNELRILGIRVTAQTFEEAIGRILAAAESNDTAFRAHFCTVHGLVEATSNEALANAFESAAIV